MLVINPALTKPAGDFAYALFDTKNITNIVWPDRLNKSGSPLSPSEGEILIEIMNDYGLEQLVHFPTRERKLWT